MQLEINVIEQNQPTKKALEEFNQYVFDTLQKYANQDQGGCEEGGSHRG